MGPLWSPDGVWAAGPQVTLGAGLTFNVPVGFLGWCRGFAYRVTDSPLAKTGVANTNTLPRKDRLVLRASTTSPYGVVAAIKQGTPATNPLPPVVAANETAICYATCPGSGSAQNYTGLVQEWNPLSNDRRRNAWSGTGTWGPGKNGTSVGNWTDVRGEGLITRLGNPFRIDQAGRWAFGLVGGPSPSVSGESSLRISWPGGPWIDNEGTMKSVLHGASPVHSMFWEGVVKPSEIGAAHQLSILVGWTPDSGTALAPYSLDFYAEYLGS